MPKLKNKFSNKLPLILLFILPIIILLPFYYTNQLAVQSDWAFHATRVQQIYENIKAGQWFTFIGTNTFNQLGNANFLFYPTIFLYPWALLLFIVNPIHAFLLYTLLMYWLTISIAYYSMYFYSKSHQQAFIFTLLYTITPYHFYLTLSNYVLGEALAYAFLPLVLLGTYRLLYKHRWKTLAVGLTLVGYCHVLSVILCLEMIAGLTILKIIADHKFSKQIIIDYCKAAVTTLVLTAWELVPFVTDYRHLSHPIGGFGFLIDPADYIQKAASNQPTNNGGIGLILLLILFAGWKFAKTKLDKAAYFIGILHTVISTNLVPWQLLNKTPLNIVQFPYRYTSYTILFLSIIGTRAIIQLISKTNWRPAIQHCVIWTIALILSISCCMPLLQRNRNVDPKSPVLTAKTDHNYRTLHNGIDQPVIINPQNYNYQFTYGVIYGETDYWPGNAFAHQQQLLNQPTNIKTTAARPNSFTYQFNSTKKQQIELPCLKYSSTQAWLNDNQVPAKASKRGLVQITVPKGQNIVIVKYVMNNTYYTFLFLAVAIWIWLGLDNKTIINYIHKHFFQLEETKSMK